jgi:hypothetical protein
VYKVHQKPWGLSGSPAIVIDPLAWCGVARTLGAGDVETPFCRCLNLSTSMGGTRSKVEGEDRHDLELKVRARTQDTRFIQVQVAGVATLRPVWSSIAPCAWCCSPEGLWMFG